MHRNGTGDGSKPEFRFTSHGRQSTNLLLRREDDVARDVLLVGRQRQISQEPSIRRLSSHLCCGGLQFGAHRVAERSGYHGSIDDEERLRRPYGRDAATHGPSDGRGVECHAASPARSTTTSATRPHDNAAATVATAAATPGAAAPRRHRRWSSRSAAACTASTAAATPKAAQALSDPSVERGAVAIAGEQRAQHGILLHHERLRLRAVDCQCELGDGIDRRLLEVEAREQLARLPFPVGREDDAIEETLIRRFNDRGYLAGAKRAVARAERDDR
jgi:hypothetical protein